MAPLGLLGGAAVSRAGAQHDAFRGLVREEVGLMAGGLALLLAGEDCRSRGSRPETFEEAFSSFASGGPLFLSLSSFLSQVYLPLFQFGF